MLRADGDDRAGHQLADLGFAGGVTAADAFARVVALREEAHQQVVFAAAQKTDVVMGPDLQRLVAGLVVVDREALFCTGDILMALFKTSNPALGSKTFQDAANRGGAIDVANRMTVNGTVNRTGVLLICAFATAFYTWHSFMQTRDAADVSGLLM